MSLDQSKKPELEVDAIVVGAGVAGLAAAFTLQAAGQRVLILESRSQVGGRVETHPELRGIDLGAAYFGPLQTYTMRFVELLEIERISNDLDPNFYHRTQWSDGTILAFNKRSFDVPDDVSKPAVASQVCAPWALVHVDEGADDELKRSIAILEGHVLRMKCNLDQPWNDLLAPMHDAMSVEEWLSKPENVKNEYVRDLLRIGVRSALSAEPTDISMMYLLYYCATGGSFVNVMAVGGGADSFRFKSGASELPEKLAGYCLSGQGGPAATLLTDHRVTGIEQDAQSVTVHTKGSKDAAIKRFKAPRCIVAASPTLRTKFGIAKLPAEHAELAEKMDMGRTIKAFVTFDKPWWRIERGASGYALSAKTDKHHPVTWTMDNTWTDAAGKEIPCLMAFIVGRSADELESETAASREKRVLDHWATIFKVDGEVIQQAGPRYYEHVWGRNEWSGGCPAAYFRPNTFNSLAQFLRKPFERIHWAGAETATDWVGGYMNGGLQSGMRAAWELVAHAMAGAVPPG